MKKICYVLTVPITVRAFFVPQFKCLTEHGYEVTVICSNDKELQNDLGGDIKYIPVDMPRGVALTESVVAICKLIKIMKKEKFDLVQYSTPNAALYASIASKIAGIKIRNYHLMGFRYLGAKGIVRCSLKWMEKISCRLSTHIECVSSSNLELGIVEKVFKREKATVVWNGSTGGVDLKRFDIHKRDFWREEIRIKLGYSNDDFIYGFVGRITKDKGINELLEAYLSLDDDSKLLMVGDVEDKSTLNRDVFEKAIVCSDINFVGSVKDIEKYYAAMDVLVLPSYREGFGNVVIEAASLGTPAIISNIPGPVDATLADVTAKLVQVKNVSQLRDAMIDIQKCDFEKMKVDTSMFAKTHFDSEILCQKILERKNTLLGEVNEKSSGS